LRKIPIVEARATARDCRGIGVSLCGPRDELVQKD
jgi:hypothetical protein